MVSKEAPPSPTAMNPGVRPLGTFKAYMATLNRKRYTLTILQKKWLRTAYRNSGLRFLYILYIFSFKRRQSLSNNVEAIEIHDGLNK